MDHFRNRATGAIITDAELRAAFPKTAFPVVITNIIAASYGYDVVQPSPAPVAASNQVVVQSGAIQQPSGAWIQAWILQTLSPDVVAANTAASNAALQESIVAAVQNRLDTFAQTRNYDGILSACTYATSANPQRALEGQYAITARDATWDAVYAFQAAVNAGTTPVPTRYAAVEVTLPPLVWPTLTTTS